jgi:small subunit ribosomal protein S10
MLLKPAKLSASDSDSGSVVVAVKGAKKQVAVILKFGRSYMAGETERIKIRMEAYDHRILDASAKEIVEHARRTNARISGPIPLPTRIERYTVLRSPHVDKKSREQFELRTHKRLIDIREANARTVEVLNRLVVPAGVFVKIKA